MFDVCCDVSVLPSPNPQSHDIIGKSPVDWSVKLTDRGVQPAVISAEKTGERLKTLMILSFVMVSSHWVNVFIILRVAP